LELSTAVTFKKSRLLTIFALASIAAAPPPPVALAPYVHDGRFDPGDYLWLRGKFDGATAAEVAAYQAMLDWRKRCRDSDMADVRSELAGLGVAAGPSLNTIPYRSLICAQVSSLPEPLNLHDWPGFVRDVGIVQPIIRSFLTAISMSEAASAADSPQLRDALNARATGEQAIRSGLLWMSDAPADGAPVLTLTPQQRGIIVSQFAIALAERDHANTAWLKAIVVAKGWPKRSQVGTSAATTAWLLVQHADADPAFQVRALRLIKPLVSTGEADRKNFAYLYDRVMLKVAGKQRYATQLSCRDGRLLAEPLENAGKVDVDRRAIGMRSLAEYTAQVAQAMGPCPATAP
jgi:hypothetical protein